MSVATPDDQESQTALSGDELRDAWPVLSGEDRTLGFRMLPRGEAEDLFLGLPARDQAELIMAAPAEERRSWMRLLPPDDAADVIQAAREESRETLLALLDAKTRIEVSALLAYAEDQAGGLMNPRYARLRPEMTVDQAISYMRRQARTHLATLYYAYVIDDQQRLLGVVSFRDLFSAAPEKSVRELMETDLVTVREDQDQESVSRIFSDEGLAAIPVIDAEGRMKGLVTLDDIVDVVQEEATEDIHKFGGMEALEEPYTRASLGSMIRKRGVWLAALFLGEMLTATAMARFEDEIARAVVLAVFVPLIISSGGNSGSQASTLVVRAMALGELRLRDWWRVLHREAASGVALGAILGVIGLVRVLVVQALFGTYGAHALGIAFTVAVSLLGVVTFGTLAGALLPFLLRRFRLDPASASAPFVATLVDVSGVIIYFTAASYFLASALR